MRYLSRQSALRTAIYIVLILGFCSVGYAEEEFTYHQSDRDPLKWGSISKICSDGKEQSPINIPPYNESKNWPDPGFNYEKSKINVTNNGHTIKFAYVADTDGVLSWRKQRYYLTQFHFHTLSEHTINGKHFPIEMHLVHVDKHGNPAAVVGVMIEVGDKRNKALPRSSELNEILPNELGGVYWSGQKINIQALLPEDRTSYRYRGSLTTPGCNEGIHWLLFPTPIQISSKQMDELLLVLNELEFAREDGSNNRPLQLRNDRIVNFDWKTD